jgi:hypothetical protein
MTGHLESIGDRRLGIGLFPKFLKNGFSSTGKTLAIEQSSCSSCRYSLSAGQVGGMTVEGANCMAYDQQFEREDIRRLVTESERHVRVLVAVAETMLPYQRSSCPAITMAFSVYKLPGVFNANTCSRPEPRRGF